MKNCRPFLIKAAVLTMILLGMNQVFFSQVSKEEKQQLEMQKEMLERFPLPESARALKLVKCFPTEKEEEKFPELYFKGYQVMAQDLNKNILVADLYRHVIFTFSPEGKFLDKIGRSGQGPGELGRYNWIAGDGTGNIIVNDWGNGRIQILKKGLEYPPMFRHNSFISSIMVNQKGRIIRGLHPNHPDIKSPLIQIHDYQGKLIREFGDPHDIPVNLREDFGIRRRFFGRVLLATGQNGDIWVAWTGMPLVRCFNRLGKKIGEFTPVYPIIQSDHKHNLGIIDDAVKYRRRRMPPFKTILSGFSVSRNRLYLLRDYPRLEIIELDFKGKFTGVFWKSQPYNERVTGFFVRRLGPKLQFVTCGGYDRRISIHEAEKKQ